MSSAAGSGSGAAVSLDLIPPELVRPRLRKAAAISAIVGVAVAALLSLVLIWQLAVLISVAVFGPILFAMITGMRRSTTINGSIITARAGTTRTVDLDIADQISVSVRQGRVTQVSLHVDRVNIALAVYMGEGGRELEIQAIHALADALATRAPDVSGLLMSQLRAEAIGTGLPERPLYRATAFAEAGHKATKLDEAQLKSLLD